MTKPWREFDIPLYGGKASIYRKRKAFYAAIEALGNTVEDDIHVNGRCVELSNTSHNRYVLGWFTDDRATLVHELGHLAIFVITNAGMKIEDSGGEAYCYLLSHFYSETE